MAFLGHEEQVRELQDRFRFLYITAAVGLCIILARLIYLQILNGEKFRIYSEENRIKQVKIAAPRGMIFDRNKKLLIDNQPAFDLEITPQYLRESKRKEEVLELLSQLMQIPIEKIEKKLQRSRHQPAFLPVKIKEDLTRDEVARIESWKIAMPGVAVQMEIRRTSVYGEVGSHLLGYIGKLNQSQLKKYRKKGYKKGDSIGRVGIERAFEKVLRGVDGQDLVEVDALGRQIRGKNQARVFEQPEKPAIPGKNLILTIDQDIQEVANQAFGETVGSLVAINPKNGEIIAMLSRPSFNATEFSRGISSDLWQRLINDENDPLRDKTIQDHYAPGSVFKAFSAIAGLEEGIITEKTTFNCPGRIKVGNRQYHCHARGGHGNVDVVKALMQSCDVFFYRLALKLDSVDTLAKWAKRFGLGRKTGIQLSREVKGIIPTEAWKKKRFGTAWAQGETVITAIGQSFVLATTLQLANSYAALANGGKLFKPNFLKRIETHHGEILKEPQPKLMGEVKVQPKNLALIEKGLWAVVNSPRGTARGSRIPGVDFAGKTGTSQVIRLSADKIYSKCENMQYRFRHHAVFAGYAPIKDPEIAVAVIGEHACSGSRGAAPVASAVIRAYLAKYFPEKYGKKALAEKVKIERKLRPPVQPTPSPSPTETESN